MSLLGGWRAPTRESGRVFQGVRSVDPMSSEGVLARSSCLFWEPKPSLPPRFALFGPHCPRDSGFKKRETLPLGSRNARPRPKHCKNRHFGRFWPKPLGPPRRPENGPPASFDDQPNGLRLAPRPDLGFPARHGPIDIITYERGGSSPMVLLL